MTDDPTPCKSATVPETNYFDKANDQAAQFDRLMVTLFSGLIAGITLLLLREEVSEWVGACLLLSLTMFVFGIGHTLLHITFHTKMLLLLEALVNGTAHVPNMIESEEPTAEAYTRMQGYSQRAYSGQVLYLFSGIAIAAIAMVVGMWNYSSRCGVILAVGGGLLLCISLALRLWKRGSRSPARERLL